MSILMYKQRFRNPNYLKTPKCNYAHIGYIATRPGASKNEGMRHGLFGKLSPGELMEFETWQQVAREVRELSYKKVNIFRSIISFAPETAAELELKDHKAWEQYIESHIHTLAQRNGISRKNLSWVCAHHNEQSHPHIHVVFWDKNQTVMKNFVHPKIGDGIRIQLIKETFPDKIEQYCREKEKARGGMKAFTDEMVAEFDEYVKSVHPKEYKRLKELMGRIDADEMGTASLEGIITDNELTPMIARLFELKDKMPKKGRLFYKLLPEEVKAEVDAFIAELKDSSEHIRNLTADYADSKCALAMLYDTDPENIEKHRQRAVNEAEKLIANKVLGVIKTLLNKEKKLSAFEYTQDRKHYYTEQLICEILLMLEQNIVNLDMDYDGKAKAMSTDLSKLAKKEWYLRHKDRGMER